MTLLWKIPLTSKIPSENATDNPSENPLESDNALENTTHKLNVGKCH